MESWTIMSLLGIFGSASAVGGLAKFQKQRSAATAGTSPDKKKKKKKSPRKSNENGRERCIERPASSLSQDSELYEGSTASEFSGTHSNLTSPLTLDSDQRSTSADEYSAEETNSLSVELQRIDLRDAKAKITQLEETLYGKQAALQQMQEEYDKLRQLLANQNTQALNNSDNLSNRREAEYKSVIEQYNLKIQEFQQALLQRDEFIRQLSVNLQSTLQSRESLHIEATSQAQQLTQQIQILQQQLRQAQGAVMSQNDEHTTTAQLLAEAQDQVEALTKAVAEKDIAMLDLNEQFTLKSREVNEMKREKEELKKKSSEEIRELMRNVEELQKKVHERRLSGEEQRTEQKLAQLRGELDEMYGQQITVMKEQLRSQQQEELDRLNKKCESLQAQVNSTSTARDNQLQELLDENDNLKSQVEEKDTLIGRYKVEMALLSEKFGESVNEYQNQIRELQAAQGKDGAGDQEDLKKKNKLLKKQLIETNNELVQVKASYNEEVASLQAKLSTPETDSSEFTKLRNEYHDQLEKMKLETDEVVAQLMNQLESAAEEKESMKTKYDAEMENLRIKYEDLLKTSGATTGDSVDSSELRKSIEEELKDELRKTLDEELREKYEKKMEDMQEHLSNLHEIDLKRLKSSLAVDYEEDLKEYKQQLAEYLDQQVEAVKAEKDKEFIQELQKVRKELSDQHAKEMEEYKKRVEGKTSQVREPVFEGEMIREEDNLVLIEPQVLHQRVPPLETQLHQMSMESLSTDPGSDVDMTKLRGENQDLSEARDALLQQIDQCHRQQEELQEELLTVLNEKDDLKTQKDFAEAKVAALQTELESRPEKPALDEFEAIKTQSEILKNELGQITEKLQQSETDTASLQELNKKLAREKDDLEKEIKEVKAELEEMKGLDASEILQEKLLSQASFFEQERHEYERELEEVSNQLETTTIEKEEILEEVTALRKRCSEEKPMDEIDGSLIEKLSYAQEERNNFASKLMRMEQENDMLKTGLEIKENELSLVREQLDRVEKMKERAERDLEVKREMEEELLVENERLMGMVSCQASATESVDDVASTTSDHRVTDLQNEISRLKKDLKETQEIYSKENALLKQALDYEKATSSQLLQQELSPEVLKGLNPTEKEVIELKQELAKKEQREHEILTEKNKQISVLQESNGQLEAEKQTLQKVVADMERQVLELQERMQTSDSVSEEVQEVFGRQLTAIQAHRDALLKQLEDDGGIHGKISEMVGEKTVLEESLRQEKELLTHKLAEKEELERELMKQRLLLDQHVSEQRKLEEMLLERDKLEQEMSRQKNMLESELKDIEQRLDEKENQLLHEKFVLEKELQVRDEKLLIIEDMHQKELMNEVNAAKSQAEKDHLTKLQQQKADVERAHAEAIARLKVELQQSYSVETARLKERHLGDISVLKTKHQSQVHWYTF